MFAINFIAVLPLRMGASAIEVVIRNPSSFDRLVVFFFFHTSGTKIIQPVISLPVVTVARFHTKAGQIFNILIKKLPEGSWLINVFSGIFS